VTLVQMFIYYQTSKRDPTWMRLLILYLFIAETANTGFNIALVYEPLILRFGQQFPLINSPIFLRADGAVTVAISTPVQLFMAWRIKVLTGSTLLAAAISFLSLVALGGGIWTTISVSLLPQFHQFSEFRAAPSTWLVSSATGDVVITTALVYSLSKKKTGFAQMDDYISRIMLATVQTGALTAIAALADAVVFLVVQNSTLFFIWDLSLSKLYTNTILSSLNARNTWQRPTHGPAKGHNALFGTSEIGTYSSRTNVRMSHAPTLKSKVSQADTFELGHMQSHSHSQSQPKLNSFVPAPHDYGKQGLYGVRVTNEVTIA